MPISTTADKPNPLIEILLTIVAPAVILMKAGGDGLLQPLPTLLLALAFPFGWGLYDFLRRRRLSLFAALGLVSTLLTGGVGLLALDPQWLAVKEAAIPTALGLAIWLSTYTRYPLIRTLVYQPALVDVERIQRHLELRGTEQAFEARLKTATLLLGGTFGFSAVMNYVLARWLVTSPAGSAAFNEELGRMTLLSYPMIAIPSMFMTMAVFYYLLRGARQLTGLSLSDMMQGDKAPGA